MLENYFEKRQKEFDVKIKKKLVEKIPKNALIELTNACNHACLFCYNPEMKRSIARINIDTYRSFISKGVLEGLEEVGLYSTGEPFMTKGLDKFIKFAKDSGIKRVYITSNGALANLSKVKKCIEAGLDSIKFSINAGSKETYKIIHGQDDFEKVTKNLSDIYDYISKYKIKFQLLCSFVVTDLTNKEKNNFKNKYQKYFDEPIRFIKAANQAGRTKVKSEILTNKINNTNNLNKNPNSVNKFKPCGMLWDRLHLTAEGNLTACCVDYENDLTYKKFSNKKKILDQFNSDKIVNLREKHLKNDLKNTICYNCIYNQNSKYAKIDKKFKDSKNINNTKKKEFLKNRINQLIKNIYKTN